MTDKQIKQGIKEARREDGTYEYEKIKEMNDKGIYFAFMRKGIRWRRTPFY